MKKHFVRATLALAALGTLSMSPANAAANVVVASPGNIQANIFTTRAVVLVKSAPATFVNADIAQHDVVSLARRTNGQPWFESDLISIGTSPITGLATTPQGTYDFKCSIHPNMRGTAVVVP